MVKDIGVPNEVTNLNKLYFYYKRDEDCWKKLNLVILVINFGL